MEVQVISNTVQKFNGESFYLCGYYYQRKGRRLHREVWRNHNGPIPKGYHVHHKDGDRSNNSIENLELMEGSDHLSGHMSRPDRVEQSRRAIEVAREAARIWHGSEEGLVYHSRLGKENWEKRGTQTYVCMECGKEFRTKHIYGAGVNRFCHPNCKAKHGRRKRRMEREGTNEGQGSQAGRES